MERETKVKVELEPDLARLIAYLAPYKEKIKILIETKFFEFKSGSIKYNFSHEGEIGSTEVSYTMKSRRGEEEDNHDNSIQ